MTPATIIVDAPFCVWQGAGLGNKCFVNFDRRYSGPQDDALGRRAVAQPDDRPRRVRDRHAQGHRHRRASSASAIIPIICRSRSAPATRPCSRLVNAYAILANQGRSVKPTLIDYVQDRHGKVIYRTDNRCAVMGNCNAADWDGKAMPRPPSRTRQLIEPMAAFQMVHIMEGVIERGTATVLRDLNRPLFGKTGTTSGPTNVWFVGGTPGHRRRRLHGLRPAAQPRRLCPGRPHRGADLQAMGADRAQGRAQGAVRRPGRDPLGADRPRRAASGCSARSRPGGSEVGGDLGSVPAADRAAPLVSRRPGRSVWRADEQQRAASRPQPGQIARRRRRPAARAAAPQPARQPSNSLQTQNGVY